MSATDIRQWLGIYVLILTAAIGGYSFLAPVVLLPLESSDRTTAFEIILPFLIAQLSAVYRFFTDPDAQRTATSLDIPVWAVKAPLIIVTILLMIEFILFGVAGINRQQPPSPETFKGLLTFCVALLNASTVLIITRYFGSAKD